MTGMVLRVLSAGALLAGLTCIGFAPAAMAASDYPAAKKKDIYAPGSRQGPFVVSTKSLGELAKDGYEIRGNLGTALVLQKGASIFSCTIPPDPEHLSYRSYFVCSELREEFGYSDKRDERPERPKLRMEKPQR